MKKIRISDLRARISLQLKTKTANARGGYDIGWAEDFKTWAKFDIETNNPYDGMRDDPGDDLFNTSTHSITVRYNSNITGKHRIVYQNDYYKINSLARSTNGNKVYLVIGASWEGTLL